MCCSPAHKGHEGLTSFPPSSSLSLAVFYKWGFYEKIENPTNIERELRSLKDLTKHFTTRADDSHATPVILDFSIFTLFKISLEKI